MEIKYKSKKEFIIGGREFKKGSYISVPEKCYTGQISVLLFWDEVNNLIEKGILKKVN